MQGNIQSESKGKHGRSLSPSTTDFKAYPNSANKQQQRGAGLPNISEKKPYEGAV